MIPKRNVQSARMCAEGLVWNPKKIPKIALLRDGHFLGDDRSIGVDITRGATGIKVDARSAVSYNRRPERLKPSVKISV